MPTEPGTSAEGICEHPPPLCPPRSTVVLHLGLSFFIQFSILQPFSSPIPMSHSSLPNPDSGVNLFNILPPFLQCSFCPHLHNSDSQALRAPWALYISASFSSCPVNLLFPMWFTNSKLHVFARAPPLQAAVSLAPDTVQSPMLPPVLRQRHEEPSWLIPTPLILLNITEHTDA